MQPITSLHGSEDDLLDLAGIEHELAAIWRSAVEHDRQAMTITRACRTNLVVVPAPGEAPDFIDEIAVRHPSRLIIVGQAETENGSPPPPIRARVSAVCHLRPGEGRGLLCSERIVLTVREGEEARVASVVRGLAVGGLPVVILGDSSALESYKDVGLLEVADRVLIDSTGAAPSVWMRLAGAPASPPAGHAAQRGGPAGASGRLFDIAWLRLAEFRRVIARAIELSPMRKSLNKLESVDIAHDRQPTSALLLASWLSYRLHWGWPKVLEQARVPGAADHTGAADRTGDGIQALDLPAHGRRVRLRIGPTSKSERLVVLLRSPQTELRVALTKEETEITVDRGAGRLTLRHGRRRGPTAGAFDAPDRIPLVPLDPARLVVQALEHSGLCDRDGRAILTRAQGLFTALDREPDKE